jgi:SAM-dependent methyltransferase
MASLASTLGRYFVRFWNPPWFQGTPFLVESMHLTRAYYVAAELGLADLIEASPRTAGELAQATSAHEVSLARILRVLAAFRVFRQDRQGRFHMTRRARVLSTSGRASLRSWLRLMGSREVWQGFAMSVESVRTGVSGFELAHGQPFYEYLQSHPQLRASFVDAMSRWSDWHCREITRTFDFSRFRTVLDVGGGMGSLVAHLLATWPRLRGIVFDDPATVAMAHQRFAAAGLADRCQFVGGSFLDFVPRGADLCVVKHVLTDWSDADAVRILSNCRDALLPGGTLLVIGPVIDPANGADRIVKLVDLEMGALTGGVLRTQAQLTPLLAQAGFEFRRVHATVVPDAQIVEAVKAADGAMPATDSRSREAA